MLKAAADLTPRQLQKQRRKWRETSNRCNKKKRALQTIMNETPPSDDADEINAINVNPQPQTSYRVLRPIYENHNQPPQTSTPKRKKSYKLRDKLRKTQKMLNEKK